MTKREAEMLAKNWRLGNKFRKKSLTKKYDLKKATSPNTGRVKMGIRIDIENNPKDYKAALDDDGSLIFFTGKPMKRIQVSDLFVPPKARKEEVMEQNIDYQFVKLKSLFQNEDVETLKIFSESYDIDFENTSIVDIKKTFSNFVIERTQYQLVAQKTDGTEIKSKFYNDENDLSDMVKKCEELEEYESTYVLKRIVGTDEEQEDKVDYSKGLDDDDENNEGKEDDNPEYYSDAVEKLSSSDRAELYKLTTLALKQIPHSPKQKKTIKKINQIRVKSGMKPLKEMEIDELDEITESVVEQMMYKKGDTVSLLSMDKKETGKAKVKSVAKAKPNKFGIKNYYVTNKGVFSDMEVVGTPAYKSRFKGNTEKEVMKALNRGERPGMKSLLSLMNSDKMSESVEKNLPTMINKVKGGDKKIMTKLSDLLKKKKNPKDIAKEFKKLSTQSKDYVMGVLSTNDKDELLQKGKVLKQMLTVYEQETELKKSRLDARTRAFREKLHRLGYVKKPIVTEEEIINEQESEHEIKVGNYTTNHFYMCGSAQKTMKANADKEGAEELTKLQDQFYKLEKEVMDAGKPTQEQIGIAHDLYHKIDHLGKARKIEMPYMKDHLNSILKGDPKPGFGRTDIKKEEVVDEAKDIEAAFDGKDSDYKKLMKDLKRARIKVKDEDEMDGFTIFRLNGSDYAIDKMLNKYPDLQVNEKFKKRFVKNIKSIKKNARSLPLSRDYILNTDNLDKLTPMNNQMARAKLSTNYDHPKYGSGTEIETKKGAVLIKPEVAELYMKSRDRLPDPIKKNMDKMALRSPDGLFTVLQAALNDLQTGMIESITKVLDEDAVARAREKQDLARKHKAEIEREKEEIKSIRSEETILEGEPDMENKVNEKSMKDFNSTFKGSKSEFEKLKKDLAKNNMKVKIIKKYPDGQIDFFVQAKNPRFVKKIQKDIEKRYDASLSTIPESVQIDEKKIAGLEKKSEKSGVPYGILKQVYNRGMAAWRTGHRPGTTPQQWAFARVNSFLTGGKTRTTADKDLWAKASAAKKKKKK